MGSKNHSSDQVDAVITWVDGGDPAHAAKRANTLKKSGKDSPNKLPTGHHTTRFLDNGELYYCVASLRKYAPWIQNIYIVTDNQIPDFITPQIQQQSDIQIVDHKEIFKSYEWALPTFNSLTIETAVWRIPGLSENFIYLNDDFILCSPVSKDDFFREGNVILRGKWRTMTHYGPMRVKLNNLFSRFVKKFLGITRSLNLLTQIRSARLADFKEKYFYTPHVPHPIRKQTVKSYYQSHPDFFEENIKYSFRDTNQHTIQYLANHLEIKNGSAILKPSDNAVLINGEMDFKYSINKNIKRISSGEVKFLCIQGFEAMDWEIQNRLQQLFEKMFPSIKKCKSTKV
jgi:hypothetical protein